MFELFLRKFGKLESRAQSLVFYMQFYCSLESNLFRACYLGYWRWIAVEEKLADWRVGVSIAYF